MNKNYIKNTDLLVSKIGLGTVRFGRDRGLKFESSIPSDGYLLNLLDNAKDIGINYIDTAPAYGTSEKRIGKLLYGQRHDWVISTKAGELFDNDRGKSIYNYTFEFIYESVIESLRRLKTDYLDMVFVHMYKHQSGVDEETLSALRSLKRKGYVRYIGVSVPYAMEDLSSCFEVDVIMLTHNKHHVDNDVLRTCSGQGKSIIVKKPLDSGNIIANDGYRYILSTDYYTLNFSSILTGTMNVEHLKEAVRCVDDYYSIY